MCWGAVSAVWSVQQRLKIKLSSSSQWQQVLELCKAFDGVLEFRGHQTSALPLALHAKGSADDGRIALFPSSWLSWKW